MLPVAGLINLLVFSALLPAETLNLSLEEALARALRRSPVVVAADAERSTGLLAAGRGIAGVLPRPAVSVSRLKGGTGTVWEADLTISQVVFDPAVFGGLIGGLINAGYHSESAREQLAGLVLTVTSGYLNLIRARELLRAAEKSALHARAVYELATERFRLGQVSRIELLRSQAQYQQAELSRLSALKGYDEAQNGLAAAIGFRPGQVIVPTDSLDTIFPEVDPERVRRQIERFHPGTKMSRRLNQASAVQLAAALLRVLPAVSWFRRFQYSDTVLPQSYRQWREGAVKSDGIGITLPLADLTGFLLNAGEALISARRSRAALARARLELVGAAESAIAGYNEARQRYQQAAGNLRVNRELHELARAQFALGTISLSALLEIESGLAQAEAAAIGALADVYLALARLNYLMGVTGSGQEGREERQ